MAFGKHLGADKNAGLAAVNIDQKLLHAVFVTRGIAVYTDDFVRREELLQDDFTSLGSLADRLDSAAVAAWAALGDAALVVAVVTV